MSLHHPPKQTQSRMFPVFLAINGTKFGKPTPSTKGALKYKVQLTRGLTSTCRWSLEARTTQPSRSSGWGTLGCSARTSLRSTARSWAKTLQRTSSKNVTAVPVSTQARLSPHGDCRMLPCLRRAPGPTRKSIARSRNTSWPFVYRHPGRAARVANPSP